MMPPFSVVVLVVQVDMLALYYAQRLALPAGRNSHTPIHYRAKLSKSRCEFWGVRRASFQLASPTSEI